MRVAVRKRMGVRTKMRTRAVKRAWWTRTRMQRRRVKWRSVCSHACMEGHLLVTGNELCFWGGRVHQNIQPCLLCGTWKSPRVAAVLFGVLLLPSNVPPLPSPCAVTLGPWK